MRCAGRPGSSHQGWIYSSPSFKSQVKAAVEKASAEFRARGPEGISHQRPGSSTPSHRGRRSVSLSRDPSASLYHSQPHDSKEGLRGGSGDETAHTAEGGLRQRRPWSDGGGAEAEAAAGDAARPCGEIHQEDDSS